ncbi:MAG: ABC transporter ATP-binding protein [Novosphingobium sp.]
MTQVPAGFGLQPVIAEARDLTVALDDSAVILSGANLRVGRGEIVALVGESGAGKTTLANAVLGHARAGARIVSGSVQVEGSDLLSLPAEELWRARGSLVAHVPQDPGTALDPLMRIGAHLDEMLSVHARDLKRGERQERIARAMAEVDLPATRDFLKRYPHQLSGGQQQRVLLALAFLLEPRLIVLDEPTTALDPHTEGRMVARVRDLCRRRGAGAIYVSHNLGVVRALAERVAVLYAGRVIEHAAAADLFARPLHPYSRGLVAAELDQHERRMPTAIAGRAPGLWDRPAGCAFAPRCPRATEACQQLPPLADAGYGGAVACVHPVAESAEPRPAVVTALASHDAAPLLAIHDLSARRGNRSILADVAVTLRDGRTTALLGASGSGKTTLSRIIAGIDAAESGDATFRDALLAIDGSGRPIEQRRAIQYVFQNSTRALNPRHAIGTILTSAIRHLDGCDAAGARARAIELLGRVSLGAAVLDRRPADLSGGERQRVAIARALAGRPSLLICDEITSALDLSVQASILRTLDELREGGMTLLLVTHDMGVVRTLADDVIVLEEGRVVEAGTVDAVLDRPISAAGKRLKPVQPEPVFHQALRGVSREAVNAGLHAGDIGCRETRA